jgi:hypothetical protein
VHIIQLPFGAFIKSLGVIGHTKSWVANKHDQQFGENGSIEIGKSQRLQKEGNAQFNKDSVVRSGVAKTIEKVRITIYFETAESDHHIPENACCIDYTETWSSKRVHCLSTSQVDIAVQPMMWVKTRQNSTLELLKQAYQLWKFSCEWLQNP